LLCSHKRSDSLRDCLPEAKDRKTNSIFIHSVDCDSDELKLKSSGKLPYTHQFIPCPMYVLSLYSSCRICSFVKKTLYPAVNINAVCVRKILNNDVVSFNCQPFKLTPINFHKSFQHPDACVIEVTINTVYATLSIYYALLEDEDGSTELKHAAIKGTSSNKG
jgi:hypothetical protein